MTGTLKKTSLGVAVALALAGMFGGVHAQTTISAGNVSAQIRDSGDIYGTSPDDGLLGLSYRGVEFVNIDNGSSWYWYKDSVPAHSSLAQYATNPWATVATPISGASVVVNGGVEFGLTFEQTSSIPSGSDKMTVSVVLTNTSGSALTDVYWGVGFDPDQAGNSRNSTYNTILGQGTAAAVSAWDVYMDGLSKNYGVTLRDTTGIGAYDVQAFIGSSCCTAVNPTGVVGQAAGTSIFGDRSISLAYHIGTMGVGETVSIGYEYAFAVPEPETYAMLLAGLGLMGFMARRRQRNLAVA